MSISERFNKAGDHCLELAGSKSLLATAFVGAAITLPFSTTLAVACLSAPAVYATVGVGQKWLADRLDAPTSP